MSPTGQAMWLLLSIYDYDDAMRWMQSPQQILNGEVPVKLIRDGRGAEVIVALRTLVDSVFF